jgi:hypothetical protein
MTLLALTRPVSPTLDRCQLTHLAREPIDVARAEREHAGYEDALRAAGCEIIRIPPEPELPDAVFVEDTAIVLDEVANLANPGAPSRRPEVARVAGVLAKYRPLARLESPATLTTVKAECPTCENEVDMVLYGNGRAACSVCGTVGYWMADHVVRDQEHQGRRPELAPGRLHTTSTFNIIPMSSCWRLWQ